MKIWNIILLSGMALALSGCTWSRVTVTTVVVKTAVDKQGNIENRRGDMDVVPQILKALPEAEDALEEYQKGTGSDQ